MLRPMSSGSVLACVRSRVCFCLCVCVCFCNPFLWTVQREAKRTTVTCIHLVLKSEWGYRPINGRRHWVCDPVPKQSETE